MLAAGRCRHGYLWTHATSSTLFTGPARGRGATAAGGQAGARLHPTLYHTQPAPELESWVVSCVPVHCRVLMLKRAVRWPQCCGRSWPLSGRLQLCACSESGDVLVCPWYSQPAVFLRERRRHRSPLMRRSVFPPSGAMHLVAVLAAGQARAAVAAPLPWPLLQCFKSVVSESWGPCGWLVQGCGSWTCATMLHPYTRSCTTRE